VPTLDIDIKQSGLWVSNTSVPSSDCRLLEVELKNILFTLNLRALDPVLRAPAFKLLIPSSTFPDWYGLYLGGWFGAEYPLYEGAASRIRIPNNVPE